MKVLLAILLLINLIFFAVMRSDILGENSAAISQPALNESKIRLIGETPKHVAASAPVVVAKPLASTENSATICMEWSDFSGADLKRANDTLSGLQLGTKLSQRMVEYNSGYWVYIPPIQEKIALNQKIAQLKARGISEYFVVQEAGEFQHAISLGVFKTEEAAQKFLESLISKEVRSAKIGERASKLKATIFVFNNIDASITEKLNAIQKDFPASELKKLPCH